VLGRALVAALILTVRARRQSPGSDDDRSPAEPGRLRGVKLNVNGAEIEVDDRYAKDPLLWVLRDVLDMHGTKFGCGLDSALHAPS